METAIKEPEDGDEARQALLDASAQAFRERLQHGPMAPGVVDEIIEQARADFARYRMNEVTPEDTRPEGYGVLNETYEWVPIEVPGIGTTIRAICKIHSRLMTTTLKVDPRYGRTQNKHTRGKQAVVYNGKPVLAWECRECSPVQWVIQ